jgi:alanine dehydrogenase
MDVNLDRLRHLDEVMPANVRTLYSHPHAITKHALEADLIVGAVLIPGGRTPVLIDRALLPRMKPGAVIVDVGVDQGGCIETSRPTTHQEPTYVEDGVVHYCVANMPGAVGRTSTDALCHATQPYVLKLANHGIDALAAKDHAFATALNMQAGRLCNQAVAEAHGLRCEA